VDQVESKRLLDVLEKPMSHEADQSSAFARRRRRQALKKRKSSSVGFSELDDAERAVAIKVNRFRRVFEQTTTDGG